LVKSRTNNSSYTIDIDGVGLITLERSLRARRIVISVKPFKGVRVAVPARTSFKSAEEFLFSKTEWIKAHLEKMRQYESELAAKQGKPDNIDMAAAKKVLTARLKQLAEKHGFRYGKLSIRRQRTRWGSCSVKNNISLNARLLKLPDDLVDYVILHELVHTHVHNHTKKFWAELELYVKNARVMARRLRTNGLELI
jgi:predicted metal-dependent hydrolase